MVLRESNQQKLTRLNKSMGNMVRRRSTLDKSKTSEPSTSQHREEHSVASAGSGVVQSRAQSVRRSLGCPNSVRPKSPTVTLDLKCTLCQARIKTLHEYRLHHQQEHPKSKHFICEHCPYVTINKLNFSHHVRTHNENQRHPDAERCRGGCNLYFVNSRILKHGTAGYGMGWDSINVII